MKLEKSLLILGVTYNANFFGRLIHAFGGAFTAKITKSDEKDILIQGGFLTHIER